MLEESEKAVILGGGGFVGSHLIERLLGLGLQVTCIDNFSTGRRSNVAHLIGQPGFEMVEQDVCDELVVEGPVRWVMHLASPASPLDYLTLPLETLRVGSLGTMCALDFADRHGARCILASTSEVYGDPTMHPQVESYWGNVNPIGPRSVYDESKRFAEAVTMAYHRSRGVDIGIVRLFNTHGPRMRENDGRAVPNFICNALRGEPLIVHGDGAQTRSLQYIDDLVDALCRMMYSTSLGPLNIGNPVEVTVLEMASMVRDLCGSTSEIVHVDPVVDDPHRRRPDITAAMRELEWVPQVGLAAGLERTIEWFRRELCPIEGVPEAHRLVEGFCG